jgi:hypothetical protein
MKTYLMELASAVSMHAGAKALRTFLLVAVSFSMMAALFLNLQPKSQRFWKMRCGVILTFE